MAFDPQFVIEVMVNRNVYKLHSSFLHRWLACISYEELPELERQVVGPVGDVKVAYYENQLYFERKHACERATNDNGACTCANNKSCCSFDLSPRQCPFRVGSIPWWQSGVNE